MPTVTTWTAHPSAGSAAASLERADGVRAGVASGSLTGFDLGHLEYGGPALERCLRDPLELARAITSLSAWIDETSPHDPSDELLGREQPSVDLVLVELTARSAEVAWVGAGQAVHLRGGEVIAVTTRHTIRHTLTTDQLVAVPDAVLDLPSRLVTRDAAIADVVRWPVMPGDRLLLLSADLLRRCPLHELLSFAVGFDSAARIGAATQAAFHAGEAARGSLMLGAIVVAEC